jgi:hypothetical protein
VAHRAAARQVAQRLGPRPEEPAPLNEKLGLADVCGIIIDPPCGHSTPHALAGFFFAHSLAQRFKRESPSHLEHAFLD